MATKHLGPFSGWQLTVIICVVFATLFFPATVWAVSGSSVFVTDFVTGHHAKVDAAGNLMVHQNGTVTVAGSVATTPATSSIYQLDVFDYGCSTSACPIVAKPPAGRALVLTDLHVDVYNATATGPVHYLRFSMSSNGTCQQGTLTFLVEDVNPSGIGVIVLPMESGLGIPAGQALCVVNADPNNIGAESDAFGYTVAPNAVPATSPPPSSSAPRHQQ